jgi:glycosyltransferase involved in cell wall biosynthesis
MLIKLLLVSARADFGGGPGHIDLLINHLPDHFEIYIACPDDKPFYPKWKQNSRVKGIFRLPHRKFHFLAFLKLLLFIRANNIALVHSHGKGAGLYSRLLRPFLRDRRTVHTFHGMHIDQYNSSMRKLYLGYEKTMARFSDTLINVSFGEQKICTDLHLFKKEKSVVIRNGIKALARIDGARNRLSLPDDYFIVTTISRFDYQKNMSLALSVAALLKNQNKILFLWIGDGEEREKLETEAQLSHLRNIKFAGYQSEIQTYLSAADVYLSTSLWEGLPLALLEACSLGLPIVATDVVGNNEVVEHDQNGFLFPVDSKEKAVEGILKLYTDKETYNKMSLCSEAVFENKFRVEQMVEKTADVYDNLLKNKKGLT